MRLIDADALEKEICSGCEYNKNKYANCVDCAIANAPTIESIKHGKWVNIFDNTWECTNCETCEQFAYNIESTSDYCPNCGAKMERSEP